MEEAREELPNFSIGIDFLGPDPTSNKNKAEKKNTQVARFANLSKDQLHLSSFGFDFLHFPRELFIYSYRLTGSNVLAQTKV